MRRTVTGVICAFGLIVGLTGCDRTREYDENRGVAGTAGEAGRAGMPRVADIAGNPDNYIGRTVTVEADLDRVYGPHAFTLDEDAPFSGGVDRDLVVITKRDMTPIDDQWMNDKVRVTGKVARFSVVEIEREIGWDLDPQIEAELEASGPVLIAQSVTRVNDSTGVNDRGGVNDRTGVND